MVTKTVFITSGSTWTVPSDFNPSNNTIHGIGGGGGSGAAWPTGGAGGGGGAYTKVTNLNLIPGGTVYVNIGAGAATPLVNGGDTWLNSAAASAPIDSSTGLLAKGGSYSANTTGGLGGQASACIPSAAAFSGGPGGGGGNNGAGGGGGGAAGPNGAGGAGGNPSGTQAGGGGGANGGTNAVTAPVGGQGGGSPTGSAGNGVNSPGGTGAGGGGGGGGQGGGNYQGGAGGAGSYWTATAGGSAGPGGGSGGGTSTNGPNTITGSGGLYGGGQGNQNGDTSGSAGQGIIVVTYVVANNPTRLYANGNFGIPGGMDEVTFLGNNSSLSYGGLGSNSYLTAGSNSSMNFLHNGAAWTVETWFNKNSGATAYLLQTTDSVLSNPTGIQISATGSTNTVSAVIRNGTATNLIAATSAAGAYYPQVWNHIAVTFTGSTSGNTLTIYVNGNSVISSSATSGSFATANSNIPPYIGSSYNSGGGPAANTGVMSGQLAGFRVSNSVVYTANFTPTFAATTVNTANTKLLLSSYGSTPIVDQSASNAALTVGTGITLSSSMPSSAPLVNPAYPAERLVSRGNLQLNMGGFDEVTNTPASFGSLYFDGSTGYLQSPVTAPGTDNFTIEAFVNFSTVAASGNAPTFFSIIGSASSSGFQAYATSAGWGVRNNTQNILGITGGAGLGTAPVANVWYHVALVRNSGTTTLYVDGTSIGSTSTAYTFSDTTFNSGWCATGTSSQVWFNGYISNLRYVKGTAVYTANFTPPNLPLPPVTNTNLLLNTPRVPLENSNLDSSRSIYTLFTGTYSYGFTNTTLDYMTVPYSTNFNFPVGQALCFEAWVYPTSYATTFVIADRNWAFGSTGPTWSFSIVSATRIDWNIAGTGSATFMLLNNAALVPPYTVPLNTWTHVAWTRDASGNAKIFVNGYLVAARTDTQALTSASGNVYIGVASNLAAGSYIQGYISNMRLVNGDIPVAYQTSNVTVGSQIFSPPTAPLTVTPNTVLLTAQSPTFTDNGVNKLTVTTSGAPKISAGGPAIYKAGTVTPSVETPLLLNGYYSYYFNSANPDYLTTSTSTATITTGNYTIECWAYGVGTGASQQGIFTLTAAASSGLGGISVFTNTSNSISFFVNGNAGAKVQTSAAQSFLPNTWNHVALVGNGGTNTLYVNGTSVASNALTPTASSVPVNIGRQYGDNVAQTWNGYISNFRVVVGTALYTANFTPPTDPLKAITNTIVLSCQSKNIVDNSASPFTFTISGKVAVTSNSSPFSTTSGYNYSGTGVSVKKLNPAGKLQVTGIFDEATYLG